MFLVTKITQGKRGKGGGFVRAALRGLISGDNIEKVFESDETVELADLDRSDAQVSLFII